MAWDAFISHASEDKEAFVRPLAKALTSLGASVWYDEFSLRIGDSLSQSIDKGLSGSRHGVVVITPHFMRKPWPQHELSGLWTRDLRGAARILPIWHKVTAEEVAEFSPTLADRVAVSTGESSAADIAIKLLAEIRPDLHAASPRSELVAKASAEALLELQQELGSLREQLSDYQCPHCGALMTSSIDAPVDEEQKHWDVRRSFACGFEDFAGQEERPCRATDAFFLRQ